MLRARDRIATPSGSIRLSRVTEMSVERSGLPSAAPGPPPLGHLAALLREMRSAGRPIVHLAPLPEQAALRRAA